MRQNHNLKPRINTILQTTASLNTRDGVRLDADIYRPDTKEKLPVLLMRQPYGRAIASTVVYAHPRWYASFGYIVVIQDVRGRGTSEGEFTLFLNEINDGFDTVNWCAQLPGSNGQVGMYGFSYQGMTQLYAAVNKPEPLKVLCPAMLAYDLYHDWAYENGSFCLQNNLAWAVQLAAETARLKNDSLAYQILYHATRDLPFFNPHPQFSECFHKYTPNHFYQDWLNHPEPGPYWQQFQPNLETVDLPMFHIGGWFDCYLRGTLNLYHNRVKFCQSPQFLIIGPWAHLPWGSQVGMVDYGAAAHSSIDELQIQWFDYFLKGIDRGLLQQFPVSLFTMGLNQWQSFEQFPQANELSYYLVSDGLANLRSDRGQLVPHFPSEMANNQDFIIRDPWRPVPSLGGHAASPAGSYERSSLDLRSDILTYTSDPLTDDLHLLGELFLELYCTADSPSFDISVILSEVKTDGTVYNFSQGQIRINTTEQPLQIPLQPTSIIIPAGNCLRLSLSADCFPAYALNLGTGCISDHSCSPEAKIITITVRSGPDYPSCLIQ